MPVQTGSLGKKPDVVGTVESSYVLDDGENEALQFVRHGMGE